jgi:hypothetical protein
MSLRNLGDAGYSVTLTCHLSNAQFAEAEMYANEMNAFCLETGTEAAWTTESVLRHWALHGIFIRYDDHRTRREVAA